MVLITGYKKKQADEKEFFLLELQGEDVEIVISQTTGLPYATTRKTLLSTTFNENMCQTLVGKQLPGTILKMMVEPYEYTVQDTGEVKSLDYKYVYSTKEPQKAEQAVFEEAVPA